MPAAAPIQSNRQLAKALGRSEAAVRKWLGDDRWPFGRAPWSPAVVEQIRAWTARTLAANPAAQPTEPPPSALPTPPQNSIGNLSPERQARLALTFERVEGIKIENQRKRGELHSLQDCRARRVRQVTELRIAFESLPLAIPDTVSGFEQIRDIIRGKVSEILLRFAGEDPAPPASRS